MKNAVSKVFDGLDRTVETIITSAFALMVIVGGLQVFSRYVLKHSLSWSEEFQKFMHIWLIFLAIPLAYRNGAHIGMNVLFDKFPAKARTLLNALFDTMWFLLGGAMVFYTMRIMEVAKRQTSPGLGLRMDIVYSCIVIGGVYLCLTAGRSLAGHIAAIMKNNNGV